MTQVTKEAEHAFKYAKEEMMEFISKTNKLPKGDPLRADICVAMGIEDTFDKEEIMEIFKQEGTHTNTIRDLAAKARSLPEYVFLVFNYGAFIGRVDALMGLVASAGEHIPGGEQ